jgi:hypothetical protein
MSQYTANTLDVTANYMGESIPAQITNISWNGDNFNGQIDGISISGVDVNGKITATGSYFGHTYSATGVVTGWQ